MATNFNDLGYAEQLATKFLHGSTVIKDVGKMKVLYAQVVSAGNAYYATPKDFFDTAGTVSGAGYLVPSGKKFVCFGLRAYNNNNSAVDVYFGSGESDVGFATTSIATNAEYLLINITAAVKGYYDISFFSVIPEGKYAFFGGASSTSTVNASIYGFEIDSDATSI